MAERVITVPSYMLGFQCRMCGECCVGWKIFVEKPLYKEIKNLLIAAW